MPPLRPLTSRRGKGSAARSAAAASAVGALERRFVSGPDGGLLEQTAALVSQQRLRAESMERVAKVLLGYLELEPASSDGSVAPLQIKAVTAVASFFRNCADIREVLVADLTDLVLRPTEREYAPVFP